ncbi:DUF1566 domain-containing protein [bacterium]|nr:DUF1566 domain-containing protein [bacterium]
MKPSINKSILLGMILSILGIVIIISCGEVDESQKADEYFEQQSGTTYAQGPSNTSIVINNGDATVDTRRVTLTLSAIDNVGVTGYYLSESSVDPAADVSGWQTVSETAGFAAEAAFLLQAVNGNRMVYAWFKDVEGNVSVSANDSIDMSADIIPPSNTSIVINSNDVSTDSRVVTLSLSATDNVGVTGYYASEVLSVPSALDSGWVDVSADSNFSGNFSFTLSLVNGVKTVYVWFMDEEGNISDSTNDSIELAFFPVSDTGQITSYTSTWGEDADYLINAPSFTVLGSGMVRDNNTKLIWQQQDNDSIYTWANAGTYCDSLVLGSQSDWRLPIRRELMSIVNYGTHSPSINGTYFPNTNSSNYWSSTTYAVGTNDAWPVQFYDGFADRVPKTNSHFVRCVRGGQ